MNSGFEQMGRSQSGMPLGEYTRLMPGYELMGVRGLGREGGAESYSQRQMKQLVDEMRFKEKMEVINKKKGKYKRSTNNCHKKYIGIAKNLVCLKLDNPTKTQMLERFFHFRNSRVYYFIILTYLKWELGAGDIRWVLQHFISEVSQKIDRYRLQINLTSNSNFVHFRRDQILEMEFSIESICNFLRGNQEEAMRLLYQKNKYIIIKKNEYMKTLDIIRQLKTEFQLRHPHIDIRRKEHELQIDEVYHWRQNAYALRADLHYPPPPEWHPEPQEDQHIFHSLKEERLSEHQGSDSQPSQLWAHEPHPVQPQVLVKEEAHGDGEERKYPLAGLESSYPIIDFMAWNNWRLQKQKKLELYIKSRTEVENMLIPGAQLRP